MFFAILRLMIFHYGLNRVLAYADDLLIAFMEGGGLKKPVELVGTRTE